MTSYSPSFTCQPVNTPPVANCKHLTDTMVKTKAPTMSYAPRDPTSWEKLPKSLTQGLSFRVSMVVNSDAKAKDWIQGSMRLSSAVLAGATCLRSTRCGKPPWL